MITLVKVNVLTDDGAVPTELRDKLTEYLRTLIVDDPEGAEHARVSLEFKHTVHNRDYMVSLPPTPYAAAITVPRAPATGDRVRPPYRRGKHQSPSRAAVPAKRR